MYMHCIIALYFVLTLITFALSAHLVCPWCCTTEWLVEYLLIVAVDVTFLNAHYQLYYLK